MAELTNLTDRISHLRERKDGSRIISGGNGLHPKQDEPAKGAKTKPGSSRWAERRMATDYFMLFVYALLAISMACQIGLIVWLDL